MLDVKVLFHSSKKIAPKHGTLQIGRYAVEPLPDGSHDADSASTSYLLRFQDEMREGDGGASQPEMESRLFLSYLALMLGAKVTIDSMMVNSVNAVNPYVNSPYAEYKATLEDVPDFNSIGERLSSSDPDLVRQFFRSCEVYRTALNLIGENNTLSYFLLTIAVECLSNKYGQGEGTCEKFVDFVLRYTPDLGQLPGEADWREFLKEIYYRHRSGFTHGGKPIPEAVALADRLGRVYVRNIVDGKEIRTPGLKWFEKVVRSTLLGFLVAQPASTDKKDHFKDISLEFGKVMLKAARDLKAHTAVTGSDFHLD